jgi:hypothetical protein
MKIASGRGEARKSAVTRSGGGRSRSRTSVGRASASWAAAITDLSGNTFRPLPKARGTGFPSKEARREALPGRSTRNRHLESTMEQPGLDHRHRDKNGEISRKQGNTSIRTLRRHYGGGACRFGREVALPVGSAITTPARSQVTSRAIRKSHALALRPFCRQGDRQVRR